MPLAATHRAGIPAREVVIVAGLFLVGLVLLAPAYGFHRDELYFILAGRHPSFGYVDQPPLTPLLAAASAQLLGLTPLAIRILPALAAAGCVVLASFVARDLGGSRRAQWLAALVTALSGLMAAGHHAFTAAYDVLAWTVVLWLVVRLLAGADPRLWLAVGVAAGIGLQNKHLVLFLGAGLAVGLLAARRWDILRSPWAWGAIAVALLIWAPNLAWQAANDFPQLEMAARIGGNADENRANLVPELLLVAGLFLFPVTIAGFVRLIHGPATAPWRPIAYCAVAVLVLVIATGGKGYYAGGLLPALTAPGALALDRWLSAGRRRLRASVLAVAATASGAFTAVLALPILPPPTLAASPVPEIYKETAEEIGWPELVASVEGVVDGLSPEERARAVILTTNYGEAGALALLGEDLPPVHSGHNSVWEWGPPADDRTLAILVGYRDLSGWSTLFGSCEVRARVDNGLDLANEEQGAPISVCPVLRERWSTIWPLVRHLS